MGCVVCIFLTAPTRPPPLQVAQNWLVVVLHLAMLLKTTGALPALAVR
jgi:hypothetical protein